MQQRCDITFYRIVILVTLMYFSKMYRISNGSDMEFLEIILLQLQYGCDVILISLFAPFFLKVSKRLLLKYSNP